MRRAMNKLVVAIMVLFFMPLAAQGNTDGYEPGDDVVIAMLGDSLTQGYGLRPEDGLVAQLQGWLDGNGGGVKLINAGVSGDTTAGGLARIDWTLSPDVDALVVALGGNDVLRGIAPEEARRNLEGIMARARDCGVPVLLVGLAAPGNYGPDYQQAFNAIYPDLAASYGALFYPGMLGAIRAQGDQASALVHLMQSDALHPNADGVALIVNDLGPHLRDLADRVQ